MIYQGQYFSAKCVLRAMFACRLVINKQLLVITSNLVSVSK